MSVPMVREFRGHPVARAFGWLSVAGLLTAAVVAFIIPGPVAGSIAAAVFALGGAGVVYALMVRPRLVIEGGEVLVVAPVGSKRFPLSDVREASGGRFLTLHRRSGGEVKVFAVQNANATLFTRRNGRTERVAAELNELLEARRDA